MKRLQNVVAGSRRTLPLTVVYGIFVWLLAVVVKSLWWVQFACLVVSVYLMMELNNRNLLIRIFSRMVSCAYIVLTCAAVFLFPSLQGSIIQLCVVASLFLLFQTYQDKVSPGKSFYVFLIISLASLADIRVFFYFPAFWAIMGGMVYSLSWRTFLASLLGIITPYWFAFAWQGWQSGGDVMPLVQHLLQLTEFQLFFDYSTWNLQQVLLLVLLIVMFLIGSIHFVSTSYKDKIRVRQIYYSFILLVIYSGLILAVLPAYYDMAIRILIISVSPLIAHFIALTSSRISNVIFILLTGLTLALTGLNLWMSLSPF